MKPRKLPGRLRGLLGGASLWAADDYMLSVASYRFREEYRRFYFRDIQAIVVTRSPRYLFSTRSIAIAAVLLFGCIFPQTRAASAVALFACAAAWWIVSSRQSCVCRLHTAVSSEVLRSIYRVRTALRFLAQVEPLIRAAQAGLPAVPAGMQAVPSAPSVPLPASPPVPRRPAPRRSIATLLLLFLILVDAATTAADVSKGGTRLGWLMMALLIAQVGAVVWMIVQHRTGRLARSALLWGIGFLVYLGGIMYAQILLSAFDQAKAGKQAATAPRLGSEDELVRKAHTAGCILFAAGGAFVMFRPAAGDER